MPNVKIYSTSTCSYCAMTKEFLKKNNIQFENIDVGMNSQASQEMMDKSGQMGVPVLDIDGRIIVGFDKEAIAKALGI
ncbi:MAG: thioredoxin family protein [Candidatus Omnitrophica bacterium]|nr:thioredoxin family protein [Candidatus Omnitrophota bacterium]